MQIVREGKPMFPPNVITCNCCSCLFKYVESDIKKGFLLTQADQYFWRVWVVYYPNCGVAINVPTIYSKLGI